MIGFDILINFIEAFIFPGFISMYFSFKKRNEFILVSGTVQFITLNVFSYFNNSNYQLTIVIILINIFSLIIFLRTIHFRYVFIVLLYNFLILITSYIGIYVIYFLVNSQILVINDIFQKILICLIAKILLIFFTIIILKYRNRYLDHLNIPEWRPMLYMQLILIISIVVVGFLFIDGDMEDENLLFLSVILIFSNMIYIYILNKIINLNEDKLMYEKQIQQENFNNEKLMIIKNIKNDIDEIEHKLFYVIYEIDNLIKKNDIVKVTKLINTYKDIVLKHKMIIDTNNPTFDCLVSLKLNDMFMKNIDIKTCIFISQNVYYDSLSFIDFLTGIFDLLYSATFIDLDIKEVFSFIKIRVLFGEKDIDHSSLIEYLKSSTVLENNLYNLVQISDYKWKLDISLKLEEDVWLLN